MKKLLFLFFAGMLLLGYHGEASALSFNLRSFEVILNENDPGLALYWTPILETPATIMLQVGETSDPFELFALGSRENVANWDDLFPKDILVSFDFSSPEAASGIGGWTRGRMLFDDGIVRWDGPTELYFGETGYFEIALLDASFDLPGSTEILATITYLQADMQGLPVPEPAGIFLLGCGILGLVGFGRKRLLARGA